MSLNGFINVDKPAGKTSFSVVAWLRRLSGEKRVGHLGTLDPFATGVLPICLGKATRLARYLADSRKTYLAQVHLGMDTDTYDGEGKVTSRADPAGINAEQIDNILSLFKGTILQVPPVFSALKYQGRRMYELARTGVHIEPQPREVTIYTLELTNYQPPFATFSIECSKGTYIRSLAHDIGQQLGCGAYLSQLTRTASGPFSIDNALSPDNIEGIAAQADLNKVLIPPDRPLANIPAVTMESQEEAAVKTGVSVRIERQDPTATGLYRAYDSKGNLIAILRYMPSQDVWHPETVLVQPENPI